MDDSRNPRIYEGASPEGGQFFRAGSVQRCSGEVDAQAVHNCPRLVSKGYRKGRLAALPVLCSQFVQPSPGPSRSGAWTNRPVAAVAEAPV